MFRFNVPHNYDINITFVPVKRREACPFILCFRYFFTVVICSLTLIKLFYLKNSYKVIPKFNFRKDFSRPYSDICTVFKKNFLPWSVIHKNDIFGLSISPIYRKADNCFLKLLQLMCQPINTYISHCKEL